MEKQADAHESWRGPTPSLCLMLLATDGGGFGKRVEDGGEDGGGREKRVENGRGGGKEGKGEEEGGGGGRKERKGDK